MLLKIIKGIWIVICFIVLFVSFYYFSPEPKNDIGIFLIWSMLVLAFPMGFVVAAVFSLIAFMLADMAGITWGSSYLFIFIVWFGFFAAGYLQWFVLVPKLVLWIKSKSEKRAT